MRTCQPWRRLAKPLCGVIAGILLLAANCVAQSSPIQTVDAKAIKSLIAQNKGKVVLLNFFATWCPPCRKEFPGIIKFHDKYKSQGLQVLEVSMNDGSEKDDVQTFIRDQKPPFPIFLAASTDEAFCKSIDERWTTELPVTLVYDREGKLRFYYPSERTYDELEHDVAPLLAQSH